MRTSTSAATAGAVLVSAKSSNESSAEKKSQSSPQQQFKFSKPKQQFHKQCKAIDQIGTFSSQNPLDTLLDELQAFSNPAHKTSSSNTVKQKTEVSSHSLNSSTPRGSKKSTPENSLHENPYINTNNRRQTINFNLCENKMHDRNLLEKPDLNYVRSKLNKFLEGEPSRSQNITESVSPSGLELGATASSLAAYRNTGSNTVVERYVPKKFHEQLQDQKEIASDIRQNKVDRKTANFDQKKNESFSYEAVSLRPKAPSITDHIIGFSKPRSATDFNRKQGFDFDHTILTDDKGKVIRRLSLTDVEFQLSQPGGIAALENTRRLSELISKTKPENVHSLAKSSTVKPSDDIKMDKREEKVAVRQKPKPPPLSTIQSSMLLNVEPVFTAIPPTPTTTISSPPHNTSNDTNLPGVDSLKVGDLPGSLSSTGFLGAGVIIRDGIIVRRLPSFPSSDSQASSPVKGPSPPPTAIKLITPPHTPRTRQRFNMPTSFSTSSEGMESPQVNLKYSSNKHNNQANQKTASSPRSPSSRSPSYRKTRSPTKTAFQYPSPQSTSPNKQLRNKHSTMGWNHLQSKQNVPDNEEKFSNNVKMNQCNQTPDKYFINFNLRQNDEIRQKNNLGSNNQNTITSQFSPTRSITKQIINQKREKIVRLEKQVICAQLGRSNSNSSSESVNSQELLSQKDSSKSSRSRLHSDKQQNLKLTSNDHVSAFQPIINNSNKRRESSLLQENLSKAYVAPKNNSETKLKQEIHEAKHLDLLRRQKHLQEQYERLQEMQKTGSRLSVPNMDSLNRDLLERNARNTDSRPAILIRRATLKKTGSENNLLNNRPGLTIATPEAGGSLTNLLTVHSPQTVAKRPHSQPTSSISVINSTNVDKPSSPTSISVMNWADMPPKPAPHPDTNVSKTIICGASYSSNPALHSPSGSVNNPFRHPSQVRTTTVTTKILGGNLNSGRKSYTSRSPGTSPTPSPSSTPLNSMKA